MYAQFKLGGDFEYYPAAFLSNSMGFNVYLKYNSSKLDSTKDADIW